MNTPLQPDSTLADLAVTFPAASRVFRRHGLDYCCHGRRPVTEACAERGLDAHLEGLTRELLDHLEKEEQGLFPILLSGRVGAPAVTIIALEREHEDVALALQKTRALTTDLVPPEEACTTWRALYLRLDALEEELMEHVHLENNVLFRRALCAEL